MRLAAFAWGHAADDIGAVADHFLGVEGGLVAGESLHDDAGLFVDQNAHLIGSPRAVSGEPCLGVCDGKGPMISNGSGRGPGWRGRDGVDAPAALRRV